MYEIRKTAVFEKWFVSLKDRRARVRVQVRIDRMQLGHFGDVSPVGDGVSEMRIFHGPGYRVYFLQRGNEVILLLNGGDKKSQPKDIALAKKLSRQLEV